MTTALPALGAQSPTRLSRSSLQAALIVTRREIREMVTDWRVVLPMMLLALLFPLVVVAAIGLGIPLLERADPEEALNKVLPFGLMVAGFFPISFSLVLALESFVGDKERNTLEALLAMPLTDGELFLGKLLAVLVPPFVLSLTAIVVFTIGLATFVQRSVDPPFLGVVILLSATEAVVMISGAVVVSSHTTSVRAANLLASFIILPMAAIVQIESLLVLTGTPQALWFFFAGLLVCAAMLGRMGVRAFNREEILAREHDELSPRRFFVGIWQAFAATPFEVSRGLRCARPFSLARLYAVDIPQILREVGPAIAVVAVMWLVMGVGAYLFSLGQSFSSSVYELENAAKRDDFLQQLEAIGAGRIFLHNLRALSIGAFFSVFTFGAGLPLVLLIPAAMTGAFAGQATVSGHDPLVFLLAFIAPHGIFEIPAAFLAGAASFRFGLALMAPPPGLSFGASLLHAVVNWLKLLGLVIPLLVVAALVETYVTPQIVRLVYTGVP